MSPAPLPPGRYVFAVFLRAHDVCHPRYEDIMTLRVSKERTGTGNRTVERYDNIDTLHQFYTYWQREAFTQAGVHLTQGPGRMWLFRSKGRAETFREGMIAYKNFLGSCLTGI